MAYREFSYIGVGQVYIELNGSGKNVKCKP